MRGGYNRKDKFKKEPIKLTWEEELRQNAGNEVYLGKNCGVSCVDVRIILGIYDSRKAGRKH